MTMKRLTVRSRTLVGTTALCLASVLRLSAQTTAPAPGSANPETEEVIELSPFVIDASEDSDGYGAKSTLAGTRVRTDLKDVASAISVVTQQFLQDTGATDNTSLLTYTTNTEVAGISGNFSAAGGSATYNEAGNLLRPANATRIRGLDAADNTRDFFLTEIPWDSFNVGRVDIQRGPNSILFGVGSPAGIINSSVNTASFKNNNIVEVRVDRWGSLRFSGDFNYVLIPNELSIRVAGLDDDVSFEQEHAYDHDSRIFGAVRYEPKWFGEGNTTTFRLNYEQGSVEASRPRSLPPIDGLTPWFTYANKLILNPNVDNAANFGLQALFNESFLGRQYGPTLAMHYDDATTGNPTRSIQAEYALPGGRDGSGNLDASINGIPFFRYFALNTNNAYQRAIGTVGGANYVNISMDDPSVFDFYGKLIDGPNKREWQSWDASNFAASQTFFNNRLGLEFVYDYQRYDDGSVGFLGGDQYVIAVDMNSHLIGGGANPNVGRPFVSNNSQYGNTATFIDRDSLRGTVTGELRGEDFFAKESTVARIIGRHVFTGLLSQDTKKTETRGWTQHATSPLYSQLLNQNGNNGIPNPSPITDNGRQINFIQYIGPDLRSRSNAAGLNLNAVTGKAYYPDTVMARYFDSRWANPAGVNFNDPYTYMSQQAGDMRGQQTFVNTSTQSENPLNYVGWQMREVPLLDADEGDIAQLYSDGTKSENKIKSAAITWQGYFLDGMVVPTFGWRRDKVTNTSTSAPKDLISQVASMDYEIDEDDATNEAEGDSKSWGIVLHMPRSWIEKMPLNTSISLFYNDSNNFKADAPRGDVFGNILPNQQGETKDYGFVINTLNDKLSLKVNWYETEISNATLQADSAGFSSSLYYIWAVPAWEATFVLANREGLAGRNDGRQWYWNYAGDPSQTPDGNDHKYDAAWQPGTPNFENSPATARQRAGIQDFIQNFPFDQAFFDVYGIDIDLAAMANPSPTASWPGYNPDNLAIQPAYQGRLATTGAGPVASVDTVSKGIEFELVAQPLKNWNITVNASKTDAARVALSPTIVNFMETYIDFLEGPAGDIILWGTDPNNSFRNYWHNNIVVPYNVLRAQEGSSAPELPEWRFNLITTYAFDKGSLNGFYVGGAYRWEDKRVLAYEFDPVANNIDVTKPIYGETEDHFDLWVGYSRKISKHVNWRIQFNSRNVGEDTHLVPVSLQPDGTRGLSRISEGMTYQLTNTFEF
jgi:outer membrane receptor protein involved in Fe transport